MQDSCTALARSTARAVTRARASTGAFRLYISQSSKPRSPLMCSNPVVSTKKRKMSKCKIISKTIRSRCDAHSISRHPVNAVGHSLGKTTAFRCPSAVAIAALSQPGRGQALRTESPLSSTTGIRSAATCSLATTKGACTSSMAARRLGSASLGSGVNRFGHCVGLLIILPTQSANMMPAMAPSIISSLAKTCYQKRTDHTQNCSFKLHDGTDHNLRKTHRQHH